MIVDNPRARSAAAREVITCLSTFATLVAMNQSFTRRLKREVDERTKQLRDALAAKTQFLSQCSHELRSPLSAVLVSTEMLLLYLKLTRTGSGNRTERITRSFRSST
jgi:signal transduction histidine kinase